MYIERLQNWDSRIWSLYFLQYPAIKTPEDQERVKTILTMESKEEIEANFSTLEFFGIINGIGPGYFASFFRGAISWVFKSVRYEYHDIEYGIGGSEKDRKKADYGLLKYSILSIIQNYKKVNELDFSPGAMILIYIGVIGGSMIQFAIIIFCFTMVLIFGRFGSFRYLEK